MLIDKGAKFNGARHDLTVIGLCLACQADSSYATKPFSPPRISPMSGRDIVKAAYDAKRHTAADMSRAAGRSHAYIQQFLARGVPYELPEAVTHG
jgi:hypothetical protein